VPEVPDFGAQILQGILALVAVCLLAWVGLRLLYRRRLLPGAEGRAGPVRVVARLPLEPRRTLYVIDAGGKFLLVGAAEGGLATLAELDRETVERALAAAPAPKSFVEMLTSLVKRPR